MSLRQALSRRLRYQPLTPAVRVRRKAAGARYVWLRTTRFVRPHCHTTCPPSPAVSSAMSLCSTSGALAASRSAAFTGVRVCAAAPAAPRATAAPALVIECAHKKGAGSVKNGEDSEAKRLGVKIYGDQPAFQGNIILRQRGTVVRVLSALKSTPGRPAAPPCTLAPCFCAPDARGGRLRALVAEARACVPQRRCTARPRWPNPTALLPVTALA